MSNYTVEYNPEHDNGCWNKALRFIRHNSLVLDVGCSNGGLGSSLINLKNCTVDGIEPDTQDAATASKKLRKVYKGTVEEILQNNKLPVYDHILFMDVIEHLPSPAETLERISTVLKPGGTIIFSIPNMAHMSSRLMLLKGDFEYGETGLLDKTHLHFYTKKEITRVFSEANLKIKTLDFTEAAYPDELVSLELEKIGLKASEEAIRTLNSDDAKIFQYVGEALVQKKNKPTSRLQYSPDPQGHVESYTKQKIESYENTIAERDLQIAKLEQQIGAINKHVIHIQTSRIKKHIKTSTKKLFGPK